MRIESGFYKVVDCINSKGGMEEKYIDKIECDLGIEIPPSYKEFMKFYGESLVGDIEFVSNYSYDDTGMIGITRSYYEKGLPYNLLVIGIKGDKVYCLDYDSEGVEKDIAEFNVSTLECNKVYSSFKEMFYNIVLEDRIDN